MTIQLDNRLKLRNGHTLGYAEYGDPGGYPVMHFHGWPSSRFEAHRPAIDEIAGRLHARIIVADRPGIGLSDYQPYTIASWPDIVIEMADQLKLERFAVMGLSSGGKFVVACAWKIPQRLTHATVVSGNAPLDLPGVKATLSKQDNQLYGLADKAPWLLRLMLWKVARDVRKNPASVLSLFTAVSEPDQEALARPDVKQVFGEMVVESFRQGTRGAALELKLEARPWGFSLQEVRMPIDVWHGEADRIVEIEQARLLAKALPNAQTHFAPNEGHTLIVNRYEDILSTIVC